MKKGPDTQLPAPNRPRLFLETALLAYPRGVRQACREFEEVLLAGLRQVEGTGPGALEGPQQSQEEELAALVADLTALGRAVGRLRLDPEAEGLSARGQQLAVRLLDLLRELGSAASAAAGSP